MNVGSKVRITKDIVANSLKHRLTKEGTIATVLYTYDTVMSLVEVQIETDDSEKYNLILFRKDVEVVDG